MKKTLIGKTVKIIDNTTNHQFKIGELVKVINEVGCGQYEYPYNLTVQGFNDGLFSTSGIGPNDFLYELNVEQIQEQIDEITEQKNELDTQINFWVDALTYMKKTGVDNYNDVEYKVYKVLQTINDDTSDIEKAKIIAKIVQDYRKI